MRDYLIEREIPGAGALTAEQLQAIARTSCDVLQRLGAPIQWLHSYVSGNKIYCVYRAENEALVYEHARQGGFPATLVSEIAAVIDPDTARHDRFDDAPTEHAAAS